MNDLDDINRSDQSDPLDDVLSRLRNEPVPPAPGEIYDVQVRPRSTAFRNAAIAIAVVAAILFVAVVFPRNKTAIDIPSETVAESDSLPILVVPVAKLKPYEDLETELRSMKEEIAELRRRAELLDVYQRTNSLLARN